jgi:hypothetical protein
MQKVQKYIPIGLLLAFTSKLLFTNTSPSEMGVIFAITALVSLDKYLEKSKKIQEIENNFTQKFIEIEKLTSTQQDLIAAARADFEVVRSQLTSIKVGQGFKNGRP